MGEERIVPFEDKITSFGDLLKRMEPQLQNALPRHIKTEKFMRVVLTTIRKVPEILDCTPASVLGSIVTAAQLGLEPDGVLGEAYLVPYNERVRGTDRWQKVCQFIPGYQGFVKLAWQSGQIDDIYAEVVYEKDRFKWSLGTDRRIFHKPSDEPDREKGEITHVYAVAKIKGGGTPFVVMSRAAVDRIRDRSKAGKNGPWVTDYVPMAKKTAVRQLQKWIPKSKEQARASALDEMVESNLDQGMGAVIDVSAAPPGESAGPAPANGNGKPATLDDLAKKEKPAAAGKDATGKGQKDAAGTDAKAAPAAKAAPEDVISKPPAPEGERELTYEEQEQANRAAAAPTDDEDDVPPWGGGKGRARK